MERKEDFLSLKRILQVRFDWSAGPYLGKFLAELRDHGKLWAIKCPGCGRILFPPRIVCALCYTRAPEFPEGWFPLSGRGTLKNWERVIYPQMDPETGEIKTEPYLHGTFMLDDKIVYMHYLGPEGLDENELREGLKVEMVMKPPEEREGKPTDIQYFRIVEE
jgi:uncharacterized OB-fold protein